MSLCREDSEPFLHLVCDQIKIQHGFAGVAANAPGPKTDQNFESIRVALNAKSLHHLKQVHGTEFVSEGNSSCCSKIQQEPASLVVCHHDADMFFLKNLNTPSGIYLVKTADCAPIIVTSQEYTALIHAGWRGVVSDIVEKTVELFKERSQRDLKVAIGPCANRCCYEVGSEVWQQFKSEDALLIVENDENKRKISLEIEISHRFKKSTESNRMSVQLFNSSVCTLCDYRFHSYRREGDYRGTNISFIVL